MGVEQECCSADDQSLRSRLEMVMTASFSTPRKYFVIKPASSNLSSFLVYVACHPTPRVVKSLEGPKSSQVNKDLQKLSTHCDLHVKRTAAELRALKHAFCEITPILWIAKAVVLRSTIDQYVKHPQSHAGMCNAK